MDRSRSCALRLGSSECGVEITVKTSVIIPARNEPFLQQTVDDVLSKASGDIEVIVVLDGYWPNPSLKDHGKLIVIHKPVSEGMRPSINAAASIAKGEYLFKLDAHCMVGEGFDEILKADCQDNWVVIPRRKRLDAENWCIQDVGKPDVDYEYLSFPDNPADFGGSGLNGRIWTERILERKDNPEYDIDDNLSFQGSAWFMPKDYFYELELMDDKNYGTFWSEAQEIGFKAWLSGGRVKILKKTFFAHLHKGKKYGRGYNLDHAQLTIAATYVKRWMFERMWHKQIYDFDWMIEKFWPIPTWPENWRERIKEVTNGLAQSARSS